MHNSFFRQIIVQRAPSSGRRGAAAVEFALVLPLFLLLLAGIVEFGQAFRVQHTLSNACRRGARAAIVQGATLSELEQKVKAQCVEALGVTAKDVSIIITVNGDPGGDLSKAKRGAEIGVSVSIAYNKACVGFFANLLSSTTLSATCVLEHE